MNHLLELTSIICSQNKLQKKNISFALKLLNTYEKNQFNDYICDCNSMGVDLKYLANAYNKICRDIFIEQLFFNKNKKYRYSKLEEVSNNVYSNSEYMILYMYGLAITTFLWPQHIYIHRFFKKELPMNKKGKYLEIGPGHGVYFAEALKKTSFSYFVGVDLSETSANLTKSILKNDKYCCSKNYEIIIADFLKFRNHQKYDAIIMSEVLEHIEEPQKILQKIAKTANNDAFIFITTCINTPAIDHINLYRNISELKDEINSSGLAIKKLFQTPYYRFSINESIKQGLPINVAMVLGKK